MLSAFLPLLSFSPPPLFAHRITCEQYGVLITSDYDVLEFHVASPAHCCIYRLHGQNWERYLEDSGAFANLQAKQQ